MHLLIDMISRIRDLARSVDLRDEAAARTPVVLKNGRTARVTMHLIEGRKEEIEATFHESVAAFFEMYPEI